ncbi:A disintegrin and metalloproteinase with thrombospondin motifs 7 [Halictus rubicundus]|uniref:A disintegrin and metalloproteinase with thrombospondin motifs 7 n=1 Tax=Halictus rubicundus TaxID=77578 RepID=UPI004035481F
MNGFQALLTFFCVLVITDGDLIEKYRGAGNVYHGRYTRDIHEPEFLIPKRVFEDGSFSTYSLPNFYDRSELSERKKRSAEEGVEDSRTDTLHLVLPFNGKEHHVELDPYHDFISPDMVIETRGAGLQTNLNEAIRFKRAPDEQCHYRGFVRGHKRSKAALSLCDGVVGYVQTDHGRYFIEPVNESEPETDGRHVHIVYQRSVPHGIHEKDGHKPKTACGVSGNWDEAWAEALADRERQRLTEDHSVVERKASGLTHSIHRYLTVGLVADRMFLDYYNNTNYEQYLLTIMNMAADYYHDATTGNQIDVILVRMIYLEKEKEEIDLRISPAAEEALLSFTTWAEKLKPPDENHPNHFDAGVLVTRYDICMKGTECSLLGLAYVSMVCQKERAGCINEDTGLTLGITIAHELGHTLGCGHDEGGPNACEPQDKDTSYYIMSPYLGPFTIRWSNCSTKFMTELFSVGLGDCLSNSPRNPPENFKFPNMLAGAMYGGDFQCQKSFPGSTQCKTTGCAYLWCSVNGTCYTRKAPLVDGTKCGENKWCIHKECVEMGVRPKAVHGGWGAWSPAGSCSRTCGGGLKFSERECNKPTPANGGRYCIGERRKVIMCNTQPCDPKKPPLRAVQCSMYDKRKVFVDNDFHTWKPVMDRNNPCYLVCVNEKNVKAVLIRSVNDTTPCNAGTNDMCINGVCRKVSCDWILDGTAVDDKCGICKGDGTKCKKIQGHVNSTTEYNKNRIEIVRVPKGARSITVAELLPNGNMFVMSHAKGETPCVNSLNHEWSSGDYECAGSIAIYTHPEPQKEQIDIKGPIAEDILAEYEYHGDSPFSNFDVVWSYYMMSSNPSYTPKYLWDFTEWSNCNVKCGGGTMISEPTCIEQNAGKVTPNFCGGITKPEPKSRVCNPHPCPAKWRVSQWSRCSACDGKTGLKHRKVQCVKPASRPGEDDVQANFDACKGRVPKQQTDCVGENIRMSEYCFPPRFYLSALRFVYPFLSTSIFAAFTESAQSLTTELYPRSTKHPINYPFEGDRPCKKTCAKKARNIRKSLAKEQRSIPLEKRAKMIDRMVDLNLARYLEKSYGVPSGADEMSKLSDSSDYRRVLHDWSAAVEDKVKRTCPEKNLTKPKPGSFVIDNVPLESYVLVEAPFLDESLQQNLSDKAYQEAGDMVGVSIDTSREKVYQGAEALKKLQQMSNRNETAPISNEQSFTYDRLARLVDPENQR